MGNSENLSGRDSAVHPTRLDGTYVLCGRRDLPSTNGPTGLPALLEEAADIYNLQNGFGPRSRSPLRVMTFPVQRADNGLGETIIGIKDSRVSLPADQHVVFVASANSAAVSEVVRAARTKQREMRGRR